MKTKIKLLSLVLGISFSGILFTQCVKNEESDGVRAVREGYANKLLADADYQKALAEKERANAEYIKLQAQWEKAEADANTELIKVQVELAKVNVELQKAYLEYQKGLYDLELEKKLLELEEAKAKLEVTLAELKNKLLDAQQAYALALINHETALIAAKQALAQAAASALANDPKLEQYQSLYEQLFVDPGYYGQKTTLLSSKLSKQSAIIELKYAVDADILAWLKKDSVKAAEELKYTKELLEKYESLDGLSVADLQAQADQAKIAWTSASITVAEKSAATLTAQNSYNEENTKYNNESTKLSNLRNKLTSAAVSLLVLDSLSNLNSYSAPSNYPASVSELVYSVSFSTLYGYKGILNRATDRLAYLKSEDVNASQSTGFGYSTVPSDYYPTKKYLEEKIAHIEDVLAPAVDRQIEEQKAKVAAAKTNLDAGKAAWTSAESAYKSGVTAVNNSVTNLRTQLVNWGKAAQDSITKGSSASLTPTSQNTYFTVIKNYYVARYNFDRKGATNYAANYVPAYAALTATSFTASTFFASNYSGNALASDWTAQVTLVNSLLQESNVKITNNYEYGVVDNTGVTTGQISVSWYTSPSDDATAYVNSQLGKLLYQSLHVYGAFNLDDIHYFLPYDTKRPTEQAAGKSPNFNNYSSSLFALWKSAEDALTTLEENKANTFYVENYKTVLALVNRTIAFYEGLATEYGALVAETEAAVAAQEKVVNAQLKVREAANIVLQEAQAVYSTALTHANNLKAVYDLLTNPAGGTLAIIKARITELGTIIGVPAPASGLFKKVQDANKALADYIAKGGGTDIIADKIAELEAEIATIDAQIAALELIIQEIEAKMEELLKDDE